MKMTNKPLALLLSIVLVLGLCVPFSAVAEGLNTDKKFELTVMTTSLWKGVFDRTEENATYEDYFTYVGDKFHELHPNVTVKVQIITGSERSAILNTALASNTQPDVFLEAVMTMTDYAHLGALVPLDDIVDDDSKADIDSALMKLGRVANKLFFYPFAHSVGLYQANTQHLRDAGLEQFIPGEGMLGHWTPEEFETVLRTLKAGITEEGYYPMGFYCANNQSDQFSNTLLKMFGGKIFNDDSSKCVANDPLTVKAMSAILSWYQDGLIQPSPESCTYVDTREMYRNQKLTVVSTSSANAIADRSDMEKGVIPAFEVSYFTMPGEQAPVSLSQMYGACVFDHADDPDRVAWAKELVRYFCSDPEMVMASAALALPVRASVNEKVAASKPLIAQMSQASPYVLDFTGAIPNYVAFRNLLYPTFQAVFTGLKDPQAAMDELATGATQLIEDGYADSVLY